MKDDAITTIGTVLDEHRGGIFRVAASVGGRTVEVLCRRSGRLVKHHIRILPGDEVTVEISPYDTTRGRILHRGRMTAA